MRGFIVALLLVGLGACQTTGLSGSSVGIIGGVEAKVDDAQKSAKRICGIIPTVTTITKILSLSAPTLSTGLQIADAICTAVNSRAAGPANVLGIRVELL